MKRLSILDSAHKGRVYPQLSIEVYPTSLQLVSRRNQTDTKPSILYRNDTIAIVYDT
jgi:hypothetical protein